MEKQDSSDEGRTRSPRSRGSQKKPYAWIAVVVVLLVVVGYLGATDIFHSTSSVVPSVIGAGSLATVGQPYTMSLYTGKFTNATVNFGDNTTTLVNYTGTNGIQVQHTYGAFGNYLVQYSVNAGGKQYNNTHALISVKAITTSTPAEVSQGFAQVLVANSSTMLVNNESNVFSPGANVVTSVGYYAAPSNTSYSVYSQSVVLLQNDKYVKTYSLPYFYNATAKAYQVPPSQTYFNISSASSGIYTVIVETDSGVLTSAGAVNQSFPTYTNYYYLDIGVFTNGGIFSAQSLSSTLTDVNSGLGPYPSLNQAVISDGISIGIVQNLEQTLVMYDGNSTNTFVPMLASAVPTVANGGVNNNYNNYTVNAPWGTSYNVQIKPYENYTFHIRQNATWQNGQPVTAWDAEYSMALSLLFIGSSPSNVWSPFGSLILPAGNAAVTDTFWNITQNLTVDNASQTITFHFQHPLPPLEVLGRLAGGNAFIESAAFIASKATLQQPALRWSPAGFAAYKSQGSASNYNTALQTNVLADGPYMISYQVPSSAMVLVKNPYFTSPGPWYPLPSINTVVTEFITEPSTIYSDLLSKQAQIGSLSSSNWNLVENLVKAGIDKTIVAPTNGQNWFLFNANVNTTIMDSLYPGTNMPATLFTVLPVRQAFAYAMNYQYFLDYQIGNKVYNSTFSQLYAGILPSTMIGAQSINDLNKTTTGVPYYNVVKATQLWQEGVNIWNTYFPSTPSQQIIKEENNSGTYAGDYTYNGKPLSVPIFATTGQDAYMAAAGTWGNTLGSIIPGATFPVIQATLSEEVGYAGNPITNPMPIEQLAINAPVTYPSTTAIVMAKPGGVHLKSASFSPEFFTDSSKNPTTNSTQASIMNTMVNLSVAANDAINESLAIPLYRSLNENLVNMSFYVWMGITYSTWIVSSNINVNEFTQINTNPLTTLVPQLYFNGVSYS